MNAERVLIAGVGALGCLFAARLSAAGIPVSMLGNWPAGLEALQQNGVRLRQDDGSLSAYPVLASARPESLGKARLALVLVKAWQTEAAAKQLADCLYPDGLALTLQNGLGNQETLAAALGGQRTASGVTTAGASLAAPGVVVPAGAGVVTLQDLPALDRAAALLVGAGFDVKRTADLAGLQWGKLVINAAINPLTAVLDVKNGALLVRPAARALMNELALETAGVAYASGITLPYRDPAREVERVASLTAENISSMLQDVRRGTQTEIDAINGAVAVRAASLGISAPLNWGMWQLVQSFMPS